MSNDQVLNLRELAHAMVTTCGLGRTAVVGDAARKLAAHLRSAGSDAVALDVVPPARRAEQVGFHTTVVLLSAAAAAAHGCEDSVLQACWSSGARYVYVVVEGVVDSTVHREQWEERALAVGFRKHPCFYRVTTYEEMDRPAACVQVLFERLTDSQLARFPLPQLHQNRLLHMDMLREVGRRGDAHCVRYHKAAEFVRPGDAVLDLACGYGYGSHILFHNSQAASVLGVDLDASAIEYARANYAHADAVRFEVGDAQALSVLPDASIDFIASFETIEHLPEPELYLDELRRILRPSGRVMVCAPNDWSDETGEDPNPHHLHVYTWQRLRDEIGARFILEKGFVQTAGGAMKCHHSERAWAEVSLAPLTGEAEWILLLGMATPVAASDVPYVETCWSLPQSADFHVSAFARDYDNPWLLKAMVTRGMRLQDEAELAKLREHVLLSAAADSADYGAALCGRAYAALADAGASRGSAPDSLDEELHKAIDAYVAITTPTPHQLRWQVSLLFVAGELCLQAGERARARERFEACASIDVAAYSPLLGNKTLEALFRLAHMGVADGDLDAARRCLLLSIEEARRLLGCSWLNVTGDPAHPLPFGPAELAVLLDQTSRAAYALGHLESAAVRPGLFVRESLGYYERLQSHQKERVTSLHRAVGAQAQEIAALKARVAELADEVLAKEERSRELGAEVVKQDAHAQGLALQLREFYAAAEQQRVRDEEASLPPPPRRRGWFWRWFRSGE